MKSFDPVCYLYRFKKDNSIAYIGSTRSLKWREHCRMNCPKQTVFDKFYRTHKELFKDVEIIKHFNTKQEAREMEKLLIKLINPVFNIRPY